MTTSNNPHPRAAALRLTYALIGAWFVILSLALGVATKDWIAAVVALGLMSLGYAVGVLWSHRAGLSPRGESSGRVDRVLVGGIVLVLALALSGLVVGSVSNGVGGRVLVAAAVAAAATAAFAGWSVMRR